jgi:hypothetical protein
VNNCISKGGCILHDLQALILLLESLNFPFKSLEQLLVVVLPIWIPRQLINLPLLSHKHPIPILQFLHPSPCLMEFPGEAPLLDLQLPDPILDLALPEQPHILFRVHGVEVLLHADYLGLFGLEALFQLPAGLLQLLG